MKSRFTAFAFLAALTVIVPTAAHALADSSSTPSLNGTSFDQYPSFIQVSGTTNDSTGGSTQFVLRCGYSTAGGKVSLDPTLNDLSLLNSSAQGYTRFQNIAGKSVVTSPDPAAAGGKRLVIEVVEPDGSVKAKNCQADAASDSISDCKPTQPLVTAQQAKSQTDGLEKQCAAFSAKAQIDPSVFSAEKTAAYKQKLDTKLSALEAQ